MCPIYIHHLHYQRALKPRTVWYQSRCNMAMYACMYIVYPPAELEYESFPRANQPKCLSGRKSINVVVVETPPQATSNQLTHLIILHADNGNLQGKCQLDVKTPLRLIRTRKNWRLVLMFIVWISVLAKQFLVSFQQIITHASRHFCYLYLFFLRVFVFVNQGSICPLSFRHMITSPSSHQLSRCRGHKLKNKSDTPPILKPQKSKIKI